VSRLVWAIAFVVAVSWPGRVIGALDGAPFDTWAEVMILALVLPALWWFHPAFLRTTAARVLVALLLAWKIGGAVMLTQGGWCGDFLMPNPPASGHWRLGRSWDARTIWEAAPPSCSAIVTRSYTRPTEFPAWMINVPYGYDRWLRRHSADFLNLPEENPRLPAGTYRLDVRGALAVGGPGTLSFETAPGVSVGGVVDGHRIDGAGGATIAVPLSAGSHTVDVQVGLTGRDWKFVPLWNGTDVFSAAVTTLEPVHGIARIAHRIGRWLAPVLITTLLGCWLASALVLYQPTPAILTALAVAAAMMAWAGSAGDTSTVARLAVGSLAAGLVVTVPERLRHARGAWLLLCVPWLAMIAAKAAPAVGRFTLYLPGDDPQTYQRFAYRIFMQGFWLEGGQATFWNQPLYRWICGFLHVFFGDSSVGEIVWDGFGLLAGAMFAFVIVDRSGGFRMGLAAAVAVLLTISLGPNWYLIGRGLSEISALLWISLASCCLIAAGDTRIRLAALAGLFGALAFYTRMNHLPVVLLLGVLTLREHIDTRSLGNARQIWAGASKRAAGAYYAVLGLGLLAFASRTWYYTGAFSLFSGTSIGFNAIGLGTSWSSWWSLEVWRRTIASVLMLTTVQDPPRFDWRSVLVVTGVGLSVVGLLRVPIAARLPLGVTLVCLASLAGGLVVRGSAYPGRFSLHLIPVAVTVSMLMAVRLRQAMA
jgi:hypothetical protein